MQFTERLKVPYLDHIQEASRRTALGIALVAGPLATAGGLGLVVVQTAAEKADSFGEWFNESFAPPDESTAETEQPQINLATSGNQPEMQAASLQGLYEDPRAISTPITNIAAGLTAMAAGAALSAVGVHGHAASRRRKDVVEETSWDFYPESPIMDDEDYYTPEALDQTFNEDTQQLPELQLSAGRDSDVRKFYDSFYADDPELTANQLKEEERDAKLQEVYAKLTNTFCTATDRAAKGIKRGLAWSAAKLKDFGKGVNDVVRESVQQHRERAKANRAASEELRQSAEALAVMPITDFERSVLSVPVNTIENIRLD